MKCDVCDNTLNENDGYLLTTYEILKSVSYWNLFWNKLMSISGNTTFSPQEVVVYASSRAAIDTPWMVCEGCSTMFSINRNQAKKYAMNWRLTGQPSSGMALCRIDDNNTIHVNHNSNYNTVVKAAISAYENYKPSRKHQTQKNTSKISSIKWWAFWKERPKQDDYEASNSNNIENRSKKPKDYSNKVKKCLNCNAELSSGQIRCPDCGSDHLVWE